MFAKLKEWLLHDYAVPKSEGIQVVTVLILTILIGLLTLGEYFFDLKATTLELILPLLVVNVLLLLAIKRGVNKNIIGNLQLTVLYLMFQLSFFLLPGVFHVIIYWMPSIPLLALIFGSLRTSHIWLVIILITLMIDAILGLRISPGGSYQASIPYVPYAFAGSIFVLTLVACFSLLYNLLGRSYIRLKSKNREIVTLLNQVKEMNGSLERIVDERTRDIEMQNKKLKNYAFMNAHLVRAPLANILGAVQHLDETADKTTTIALMEIVKVSASDLDELIKEIGRSLDEKSDS